MLCNDFYTSSFNISRHALKSFKYGFRMNSDYSVQGFLTQKLFGWKSWTRINSTISRTIFQFTNLTWNIPLFYLFETLTWKFFWNFFRFIDLENVFFINSFELQTRKLLMCNVCSIVDVQCLFDCWCATFVRVRNSGYFFFILFRP